MGACLVFIGQGLPKAGEGPEHRYINFTFNEAGEGGMPEYRIFYSPVGSFETLIKIIENKLELSWAKLSQSWGLKLEYEDEI